MRTSRRRHALLALLLLLVARSAAADDRPNLVLFLVDDLGWQDVSVPFHSVRTPFNDRYHTPNLERLAASGMRFSDAYAACPVCSPTRASILTGKYPARLGLTQWIGGPQPERAPASQVPQAPDGPHFTSP